MPLDHYITLGRSGLKVSPLCLGTMTFGEDWGWGSDLETSKKVIDAYLDRGGNFLDTANIYTKGHSETIIGDHVCSEPAKRDRLVIATKCTGNMFRGDPNGGGSGRKAMINAVEESLRRLRTDHIDLLWSHFWDQHTPIEELLRTVDDLVRAGKVRYFGLSDHPAWVCAMAQYESTIRGFTPIVALQIEYSLRERTVEGELLPMAQHLGMGVTPWSPLAGGILTGKYTRDKTPSKDEAARDWSAPTDRDYDIVDVLIEVAKETGATPAQVALKWVQDRPGVTSTIIGARTMPQLEANLDALAVTLTDDQTTRLDAVSEQPQAFPHAFLDKVKTVIQHGATINGDSREPWPLGAEGDRDRH
jgi:aryl-alcohol dehydrogenase-like predicted oxidoreductase